jgi:hypothetical protein
MIAAMSVLISKFQNTPDLSAVIQAINVYRRLVQVHDCLVDWEVIPSTSTDTVISSPAPSRTHATADQHARNLYAKRPLPALPTKSSKSKTSGRSKGPLKVTCRHGLQSPKVETISNGVPERPSLLEAGISDEQGHERFAVGLWGILGIDDNGIGDFGLENAVLTIDSE